MAHKKKLYKKLCVFLYSTGLFLFIFGLGMFISLDVKDSNVIAKNGNYNKSLTVSDLASGQKELVDKELTPMFYNSFDDAVQNAKKFETSFKGKLVHYGPDCAGCGGHLGCNGQNALNGNIYYNDKEYGKIRIVAASSKLPCGSIIRINIKQYDYMYVVVLDRGVSGGTIDLLKESQKSKSPVRTMNSVVFDIVRYGY